MPMSLKFSPVVRVPKSKVGVRLYSNADVTRKQYKRKVDLSMCSIKHYVVRMCGGVEV
jgi:hypothetical protein